MRRAYNPKTVEVRVAQATTDERRSLQLTNLLLGEVVHEEPSFAPIIKANKARIAELRAEASVQ